jgi:hypothetical protein
MARKKVAIEAAALQNSEKLLLKHWTILKAIVKVRGDR